MATVPEIISSQQVVANNYVTQAQAFVDRVANLANTEFAVTVPAGLGFGLTNYSADALDKINNLKPDRPTLGAIEAVPPTAPIISFNDIDQTLVDAVRTKLLDDLENGGYGIEPADEAMLVQRVQDREAQIAMAEEEEVTRSFAESGFSFPPGAMFAAQARARQRAQDKMSSVNRDVYLKRADMYVQNRRFVIEQASGVEGVLINLHRAVTEHWQIETALFGSQIAKYRADIDGQAEVIRSNLGIYTADVSAFRTAIDAISEAYKLKLTELGMTNSWNVEVVRSKLQEAQLLLQRQVASAGVRNSAAQFGAQYYLGAITSALGSINTLAAQTTTS